MLSNQRKLWLLRLVFFLGLGLGFEFGDALKVPFRVKDVLPVLPRQVSWPVLNNMHSAVDLLPQYIGSLLPHNGTVVWKGACFFQNEAKVDFTGAGDRGIGGGVIRLSVCEFILFVIVKCRVSFYYACVSGVFILGHIFEVLLLI